jgi:hypothetical protein
MDWFERITGFREADYETTRKRLAIDGEELVSLVNGSRHGIGRLEICELGALRRRTLDLPSPGIRTTVNCVAGDVRALHLLPENEGALFQVASQFNLLEMVSPNVSPEDGVARYAYDKTQGPACAMAAGAATIYRNYFASINGELGQTAKRQIDALEPLGERLVKHLDRPVHSLWDMRNGYALCTPDGLAAIGRLLRTASDATIDEIREGLSIGLHIDVEVTDATGPSRPKVSQAFCSALPVSYSCFEPPAWEPFARLVLEAAYEATLSAAVERRCLGAPKRVLLTRLGGGAFGNDDRWIDDAIARALVKVEWAGLDVRLVSFGSIHPANAKLAACWEDREDRPVGQGHTHPCL